MIKVSVIVAVYNPGAHIDQLINSLLTQTLSRDEWEVIFADDDSTDGSRQRLQAFAAGQRNVTVLHNAPNSGWPGRPRNLAVDIARGDYVFFADHDDWLPADALKRLVAFADKHGSDVVVPKETGHGHNWGWEAFAATKPRAEIGVDPLWVPPTPHKLFRRAFLAEHGIRFPEGKVRLEDHLVITKAYFAADVVSLYSDYVCYHWVHRDENNASLQPTDPRSYYRDLDTVLDVVAANTEPGELRNRVYLQWYIVNMLRRVGSSSFLRFPAEHQERLVGEVRRITLDRFPVEMDRALPSVERARAHLVRAGRLDLLRALAEHGLGTTASVTLTDVHWTDDVLHVAATAVLVDSDGVPVRLTRRDGRVYRALPPELEAEIPPEALDITDALPRATVGMILRDRSTQDIAELASEGGVRVEEGPDGPYLTASVRVAIDPRTAFRGGALPRLSDVYLRFGVAGWFSERRVPFDTAARGDVWALVHPLEDAEITAYGTQGTDNLSVRRLGRPPKRLPAAPAAAPTAAPAPTNAGTARPGGVTRRIAGRLRRAPRG